MHINEGILKKQHPHPISFFGFYFISLVIIAVGLAYFWQLIALGVLMFIFGEVLRKATTYYVLDSGVAKEYKFLSTSRKFSEYEKIQNVEVSQSFFENILGIGSVRFDTAGTGTVEVSFRHVYHPYSIEKIVREKMALK
ncbi:MAG: PH domain-containing protein [Patescibacteria group bacterium]